MKRYKKCRKVGMRHGQPHWVRENTDEFDIDADVDDKPTHPDCQKDRTSSMSDSHKVPSPEYFQRFISSMESSPNEHHHDHLSSCPDEEREHQKFECLDDFSFDQEEESPGEWQQGDFVDHLVSNFGIPDLEGEKFEMFEYLQSHKDLIDDENIVRSIIQQAQSLMDDLQTSESSVHGPEPELSAEDNESEQFHYEHMMHIPNAPTMSFTQEERLCVKHLLQVDQDSRVALKDSMKSFGNSIVKQVSFTRWARGY